MSKPQKETLVLDFDNMLTAAPEFWKEVIELAKKHGIRVFCLTQRFQSSSNIDDIDGWLIEHGMQSLPVFYTNHGPKTEVLKQMGVSRFFLCDDDPERAVRGI